MAEDVQQEKLTPQYARNEYGVVIDDSGNLDLPATDALRAELAAD